MKGRRGGFTVAELLVAMMISSIVLGAVATLAFATGKADRAMDELLTARQLTRFNNSKISDALRYSRTRFGRPMAMSPFGGRTMKERTTKAMSPIIK